MNEAPITLQELTVRLESAARMETIGLNHQEFFCAQAESRELRELAIGETLRQAAALALASKIAFALAKRPDLALGLGLDALEELQR